MSAPAPVADLACGALARRHQHRFRTGLQPSRKMPGEVPPAWDVQMLEAPSVGQALVEDRVRAAAGRRAPAGEPVGAAALRRSAGTAVPCACSPSIPSALERPHRVGRTRRRIGQGGTRRQRRRRSGRELLDLAGQAHVHHHPAGRHQVVGRRSVHRRRHHLHVRGSGVARGGEHLERIQVGVPAHQGRRPHGAPGERRSHAGPGTEADHLAGRRLAAVPAQALPAEMAHRAQPGRQCDSQGGRLRQLGGGAARSTSGGRPRWTRTSQRCTRGASRS